MVAKIDLNDLKLLQLTNIGVPYRAAQAEAHRTAISLRVDKVCFLQLVQVVGDSGRADASVGVELAAEQDLAGRDLLQHGKTTRIGQRPRDRLKLLLRQRYLRRLCLDRHSFLDGTTT